MPQQRRILCCMCVNNGRGLWAPLDSRTLDGGQMLETPQARPQSFSPSPLGSESPTPLHRNRPHGRELVRVLFLTSTLGGTPELVMRKFQECWALPVLGAGPEGGPFTCLDTGRLPLSKNRFQTKGEQLPGILVVISRLNNLPMSC